MDVTAIGSGLGGDETLVTAMLKGLVTVMHPSDRLWLLAARGARLPESVCADPRVQVDRISRSSGPRHFGLDVPRWLLRLRARGVRPDVLATNTHAPLGPCPPNALMVTDLSFLRVADAYPPRTRQRLRWLMRYQVPRADAVMTISEFCKRDIVAEYAVPEESVGVVPIAIEAPGTPSTAAGDRLRSLGVQPPYLVYLGNLHPRKNVPRALSAFLRARQSCPADPPWRFVVAGRPWFGGSREQEVAAAAPPGSVIMLDRVDDEEREVLLREAEALVYVSLFEGFGLPPLEAMVRGTPVVASHVSAIPEVCGDAAWYVDPTSEDSVAEGLVRVMSDPALRAALRTRGHDRASHFTTPVTGAAFYDSLCRAANAVQKR